MSALLSMQDNDDDKDKYIKTCAEDNDIIISCPDINASDRDFIATSDSVISYGLASIRGIGEAKIESLLNNRPYSSLSDLIEKNGKSIVNKTVGENLIKSGALDSICGANRYQTLNDFYDLRKDKENKVSRYVANDYNRKATMKFETYTLGSSVTYKSAWLGINNNRDIYNQEVQVVKYRKHVTKKTNKEMAFVTVDFDGTTVEGAVFPKIWQGVKKSLLSEGNKVLINGKKDNDGKLIINTISEYKEIPISSQITGFVDPFADLS